jgi:hypothetical protein
MWINGGDICQEMSLNFLDLMIGTTRTFFSNIISVDTVIRFQYADHAETERVNLLVDSFREASIIQSGIGRLTHTDSKD